MIIGVDFDGTCVTHDFPYIGFNIGAAPVLKKLAAFGHKLVLFTMRSDIENPISSDNLISNIGGNYLTDAVDWFKKNNIPLFGINTNPEQKSWTTSPKAYCNIYIDDAALGAPLKIDHTLSNKPFVDWSKVEEYFKLLNQI
jgi:hypothetical protein